MNGHITKGKKMTVLFGQKKNGKRQPLIVYQVTAIKNGFKVAETIAFGAREAIEQQNRIVSAGYSYVTTII